MCLYLLFSRVTGALIWVVVCRRYLTRPPLATDSRRRADRHALQQREMTHAAAEQNKIYEEVQQQRKVGSCTAQLLLLLLLLLSCLPNVTNS